MIMISFNMTNKLVCTVCAVRDLKYKMNEVPFAKYHEYLKFLFALWRHTHHDNIAYITCTV